MTTATVITISSNKGGAGKTTTAVHLAAGLANAGYKVLLVGPGQTGALRHLSWAATQRRASMTCSSKSSRWASSSSKPDRRLHLLVSNSETIVAQDFARMRNAQVDLLKNDHRRQGHRL